MINTCCCTCVLMSDPFTGSISSSWDQLAGSWSTSAGALTTSDASGLLVHTTAVPGNKGIWKVPTTGFSSSPSNTPFRLVAWKDANNYAYIQITNNGSLTLGYFSGGVETVLETRTGLTSSTGDDDQRQFRLCWDGSRLVGGYQNATVTGPYTAPDNLRPGFATPAAGTSWTWSGAAELSYHNEEKGSCPTCATCWDLCETFPSTIELYIPAGTFTTDNDDDWTCLAGCEALNDQTFVLTESADGDVGQFGISGTTTFKTACPMYEYTEGEFCDLGEDTITALRIRAVWYASEAGDGYIIVTISIHSTCVNGVSGNITKYEFITPALPIPSWGACVDATYQTDGAASGTIGNATVVCHGFGLGFAAPACAVDNTKLLTISI